MQYLQPSQPRLHSYLAMLCLWLSHARSVQVLSQPLPGSGSTLEPAHVLTMPATSLLCLQLLCRLTYTYILIQPPLGVSTSTSMLMSAGGTHSTWRYLMSMRPASMGAILLKVRAWMSRWSGSPAAARQDACNKRMFRE